MWRRIQLRVVCLCAALAGLALPAAAQCPAKTTVADTLQNANGSPAAGRVLIAWPTFQAGACQVIAGQISVSVTGGAFSVALYPNDAAVPAGTSYRATYYLKSGRVTTEYWVVPASPTAVTLAMVRSPSVPVPAVMVSQAQVTNLVADLGRKLELPPLCPAGKFLQSNGAPNPPQVTCVDGSGAPLATSTLSGLVKTDVTEADPRVYTKASADALLAGKANASHTHAAGDIASGTIATARLGSGAADASAFLRGDQTWAAAPAAPVSSVFGRTGAVAAQSGDYSASQISNAFDLTAANTLTNVAAPGTPAPGKTSVWADSADKNLKAKDDSGAITVTVKPDSGAASNFLTAIAASGVLSKAQPSFSNLSGTIAASQQNNPAVGAKGGVEAKTCSGTNKLSAIGSDGVPVCSADQSGGANHDLLSATHTDTTAGAVARGDLVTGQGVTPFWARLAHPGNANRFLHANASEPGWAQVDLATGDVTGILGSANGGTGNGFAKFTGPAASEKTFTLPNASVAILTDNAAVTIAQGGTGQTTQTAAFNALDPLTTKGDITVHNGSDSVRLAVGSDGQVLTADSAQSAGVKWAAGGSGAPTDATYVTVSLNGTLSAERTINPRDNLAATDNGANGNYTIDFNPLDRSALADWDDFWTGTSGSGSIGKLGWALRGQQSVTAGISAAHHPGIVRVSTGTTANNGTCIESSSAWFLQDMGNNTDWEMVWVFRMNSTTQVELKLGVAPQGCGQTPTDGIWVRYIAGTDTNFTYEARASSTSSTADSGVVADTNWHWVRIRSIVAGQVKFSIDGGAETTISTNVPTVAMQAARFSFFTQTASAKSADLDFFALKLRGLSR